MQPSTDQHLMELYPELRLPLKLLGRYLFFLTRRPISQSNRHYIQSRIDGLRSLVEPIQAAGLPRLDECARLLEAMTPQNFQRLAERVQFILLPYTRELAEAPGDHVVSDQPPRADFLAGLGRLLLIYGPAIGIGDEMITFPLPRRLKALSPGLATTVLSAYRGLWERVVGVDQARHYGQHRELLGALRGEPPYDGYDAIFLVDFESPDLYYMMCREQAPRYVELSLGGQSLFAVDNRHGWLHRLSLPATYFRNYYAGADYLLGRLGLPGCVDERFDAVLARTGRPPEQELRIYVNPFTSKFDPSPLYWSRLLASLFPRPPARPVRLLLDPGANLTTRRFAAELAQAVTARTAAGVRAEVAHGGDGAGLPLPEVLELLAGCHIVLCTDSFAAHAAPVLGCTALVLAGQGLEHWRAPGPRSFYLPAELPLEEVIAAMRQILAPLTGEPPQRQQRPQLGQPERQLDECGQALQTLLERDPPADLAALCAAFARFAAARQAVVERLAHWPAATRGLLADMAYERPLRVPHDGETLPPALQADLRLYLVDCWQQWRNSNLHKYLALLLAERAA